jgi:hypothetical protein
VELSFFEKIKYQAAEIKIKKYNRQKNNNYLLCHNYMQSLNIPSTFL